MVPVKEAVAKHGYPWAVMVPETLALLPPTLGVWDSVPETLIGEEEPVNAAMYCESIMVPVKLPFKGGMRAAVQVPVEGSMKQAPVSA